MTTIRLVRSAKALVLEQQTSLHKVLARVAFGAGASEVTFATSTNQADSFLERSPYDAVLVDIHSKPTDVYIWVEHLMVVSPRTLCFLMTSSIDRNSASLLRVSSASGVLLKPFGPAELTRKLADFGQKFVFPDARKIQPVGADSVKHVLLD